MAVKKVSRKGKGSYAAYKNENRVIKNRAAKLARHLKKHPLDAVAAKASKTKRGHLRKIPVAANSTVSKVKLRDASGKLIPWPTFTPPEK